MKERKGLVDIKSQLNEIGLNILNERGPRDAPSLRWDRGRRRRCRDSSNHENERERERERDVVVFFSFV